MAERGRWYCRKKRYFVSRELAEQFVRDRPIVFTKPTRVYACPFCFGWHITSHFVAGTNKRGKP